MNYLQKLIYEIRKQNPFNYYNLKRYFGEVFYFHKEKEVLNNRIHRLEQEIINLNNIIKKHLDTIKILENIKKIKNRTLIPTKNITYRRQVFINNKAYWTNIDVRQFINTNYLIEQEIRNKNLFYDGKQDLNTLIPKIIKQAQKNYKYEYDTKKGHSEYWLFPYETQFMIQNNKGADCEDWAILIASYLKSAGIPSENWFISAGTTRSGYGHATIYFNYKNKWYHINSTTQHTNTKITQYPTKEDETDKIGIHPQKFWFSFNDKISINKFETTTAKTNFNKNNKNITIK
jgi:predicted transglutaminase-like cysteine proteinase